MEDTIGLAGSLGLINKGGAAFGGNVLTRAANKELEISVAEKKAEAARLAKQAQEEKVLSGRLKVTGKFDEIARKDVEKNYNDMLITKGYLDPQRTATFNYDVQRQEEATKERAAAKELFSKNDYLISPEDRKALVEQNIPYLTERAKDATSGIKVDENLPNVFRVAPEKMIKRLDANKMMTDIGSNIPKDAPSYDYSQKSKTINVNGKNVVMFPVKNEILNRVAENVFGYGVEGATQGNPEIAQNFISANRPKIDAEIAANPKLTPYEATKKVFIDVLREKTMGGDENKPSGKGSVFNWNSGSGGSISNGEIALDPITGDTGGYNVRYEKGKNPELKSYNFSGTDKKGNPITISFSNVDNVYKNSDGTAYVVGAVGKDDLSGKVISGTIYNVQPSELFSNIKLSQDGFNKLKAKPEGSFNPVAEYKAREAAFEDYKAKNPNGMLDINTLFNDPKITKYVALKPVKKVETAKPATAKSAKSVKMDMIKSKVGTKGFEGYTEKELVDYYKSQGYTVN